jgi:hypothetical protein
MRTALALALLVVPWTLIGIWVLWICRRWGFRVSIVKQEVLSKRISGAPTPRREGEIESVNGKATQGTRAA